MARAKKSKLKRAARSTAEKIQAGRDFIDLVFRLKERVSFANALALCRPDLWEARRDELYEAIGSNLNPATLRSLEKAEREADWTDRLAHADAERGAIRAALLVAHDDDNESARAERDRLVARAGSTETNSGKLTEDERKRIADAEREAAEQATPIKDAYKDSSGPKLQALAFVANMRDESVSGLKKRLGKRSRTR